MTACNTQGARFPEKVEIAYGPTDAKPPEVTPIPLYRQAATSGQRKELLAAVLELSAD